MMTKNIKLGPHETQLLFTLEEKGIAFFDFQTAKKILNISDSSVQNLLYRLKHKNRITELEKGKYVLNPAKSGPGGFWSENAFLVTHHLVKEYYLGFWSALSYWGFTEQLPQTVLAATPHRKKTVFYGGQKIQFIAIARKRFFGFVQQEAEGGVFRIASKEKAILDALTYPKYCGGLIEVTKALWNAKKDLNWQLMLAYLDELDVGAVTRRLGYLLQVLEIQKTVQKKLKKRFNGFRWLDPSKAKTIKAYSKEWGLQLNLTLEELLSWRGS